MSNIADRSVPGLGAGAGVGGGVEAPGEHSEVVSGDDGDHALPGGRQLRRGRHLAGAVLAPLLQLGEGLALGGHGADTCIITQSVMSTSDNDNVAIPELALEEQTSSSYSDEVFDGSGTISSAGSFRFRKILFFSFCRKFFFLQYQTNKIYQG